MHLTLRRAVPFSAARGFSLVELSVVVAIMSVVAVLGLEGAANFVNRTAGALTKDRMVAVDDAIDRFFKIYGRLPCPAAIDAAPTTGATYGSEDCTIAVFDTTGTGNSTQYGGGLMKGAIPFRVLNLPMSYASDGFGDKINYVVTKNLTVAGGSAGNPVYVQDRFTSFDTNAASTTPATATAAWANAQHFGIGGIEIRTGVLEQPCGGSTPPKCQVVANPVYDATTNPIPNGAAYILFSNGSDKRGAYSTRGVLQAGTSVLNSCIPTAGGYAQRPDSQNCVPRAAGAAGQGALTVSGAGGSTIPYNVYYDNRYNAGLNLVSYFDDYVVWRARSQL